MSDTAKELPLVAWKPVELRNEVNRLREIVTDADIRLDDRLNRLDQAQVEIKRLQAEIKKLTPDNVGTILEIDEDGTVKEVKG